MEIRSILVNVDLDTANSRSLPYAIDLAQRFDAELIGVAADQPTLTFVGIDGGAAAVDFYAAERTEIEAQLKRAQDAFRSIVPASIKTQWRAYVDDPTRALIDTARIADLVVTGSTTASTFAQHQQVNLGELVLASGRPVLDVANREGTAKFDKVVIGWKDTREARRAVADALPFLQAATEVTALTISEGDGSGEQGRLDDLVAWLARHGVAARGEVIANPEGFVDILESTARTQNADLVVTGGYGHSRMREWLFGGVTRNLLAAENLNRLFAN